MASTLWGDMNQRKKERPTSEVEKKVAVILKRAREIPRFQAQRERDALIHAIQYGHADIAKVLLDKGVEPNSREPSGRSALWYAAYWGRSGLIRDLVKRGAELPDDVLMGPVHDGDIETVRFLIRHGAIVNCVATFTRYSNKFPKKEVLLTSAIETITKMEIVNRVVRNAASAKSSHQPNKDWEAIPVMLIKAGAEVNRLAHEYSLYKGYIRTILGLAAFKGRVRVVRAMLAAGAKVDQQDTWGGTALLDAAQAGHRKIVRILLAAGAKPDVKRRDGTTAISIARDHGFMELADEIKARLS